MFDLDLEMGMQNWNLLPLVEFVRGHSWKKFEESLVVVYSTSSVHKCKINIIRRFRHFEVD
jgi:hypothetical protein